MGVAPSREHIKATAPILSYPVRCADGKANHDALPVDGDGLMELVLIPITSENFPDPGCALFQHLFQARQRQSMKYGYASVDSGVLFDGGVRDWTPSDSSGKVSKDTSERVSTSTASIPSSTSKTDKSGSSSGSWIAMNSPSTTPIAAKKHKPLGAPKKPSERKPEPSPGIPLGDDANGKDRRERRACDIVPIPRFPFADISTHYRDPATGGFIVEGVKYTIAGRDVAASSLFCTPESFFDLLVRKVGDRRLYNSNRDLSLAYNSISQSDYTTSTSRVVGLRPTKDRGTCGRVDKKRARRVSQDRVVCHIGGVDDTHDVLPIPCAIALRRRRTVAATSDAKSTPEKTIAEDYANTTIAVGKAHLEGVPDDAAAVSNGDTQIPAIPDSIVTVLTGSAEALPPSTHSGSVTSICSNGAEKSADPSHAAAREVADLPIWVPFPQDGPRESGATAPDPPYEVRVVGLVGLVDLYLLRCGELPAVSHMAEVSKSRSTEGLVECAQSATSTKTTSSSVPKTLVMTGFMDVDVGDAFLPHAFCAACRWFVSSLNDTGAIFSTGNETSHVLRNLGYQVLLSIHLDRVPMLQLCRQLRALYDLSSYTGSRHARGAIDPPKAQKKRKIATPMAETELGTGTFTPVSLSTVKWYMSELRYKLSKTEEAKKKPKRRTGELDADAAPGRNTSHKNASGLGVPGATKAKTTRKLNDPSRVSVNCPKQVSSSSSSEVVDGEVDVRSFFYGGYVICLYRDDAFTRCVNLCVGMGADTDAILSILTVPVPLRFEYNGELHCRKHRSVEKRSPALIGAPIDTAAVECKFSPIAPGDVTSVLDTNSLPGDAIESSTSVDGDSSLIHIGRAMDQSGRVSGDSSVLSHKCSLLPRVPKSLFDIYSVSAECSGYPLSYFVNSDVQPPTNSGAQRSDSSQISGGGAATICTESSSSNSSNRGRSELSASNSKLPSQAQLENVSAEGLLSSMPCKCHISGGGNVEASSNSLSLHTSLSAACEDVFVRHGDLIAFDGKSKRWVVDRSIRAEDVALSWIRRVILKARVAQESEQHWLRDAEGTVVRVNRYRIWRMVLDTHVFHIGVGGKSPPGSSVVLFKQQPSKRNTLSRCEADGHGPQKCASKSKIGGVSKLPFGGPERESGVQGGRGTPGNASPHRYTPSVGQLPTSSARSFLAQTRPMHQEGTLFQPVEHHHRGRVVHQRPWRGSVRSSHLLANTVPTSVGSTVPKTMYATDVGQNNPPYGVVPSHIPMFVPPRVGTAEPTMMPHTSLHPILSAPVVADDVQRSGLPILVGQRPFSPSRQHQFHQYHQQPVSAPPFIHGNDGLSEQPRPLRAMPGSTSSSTHSHSTGPSLHLSDSSRARSGGAHSQNLLLPSNFNDSHGESRFSTVFGRNSSSGIHSITPANAELGRSHTSQLSTPTAYARQFSNATPGTVLTAERAWPLLAFSATDSTSSITTTSVVQVRPSPVMRREDWVAHGKPTFVGFPGLMDEDHPSSSSSSFPGPHQHSSQTNLSQPSLSWLGDSKDSLPTGPCLYSIQEMAGERQPLIAGESSSSASGSPSNMPSSEDANQRSGVALHDPAAPTYLARASIPTVASQPPALHMGTNASIPSLTYVVARHRDPRARHPPTLSPLQEGRIAIQGSPQPLPSSLAGSLTPSSTGPSLVPADALPPARGVVADRFRWDPYSSDVAHGGKAAVVAPATKGPEPGPRPRRSKP